MSKKCLHASPIGVITNGGEVFHFVRESGGNDSPIAPILVLVYRVRLLITSVSSECVEAVVRSGHQCEGMSFSVHRGEGTPLIPPPTHTVRLAGGQRVQSGGVPVPSAADDNLPPTAT